MQTEFAHSGEEREKRETEGKERDRGLFEYGGEEVRKKERVLGICTTRDDAIKVYRERARARERERERERERDY